MKPLMEFLKTAKWTHVLAGIVSVSVVQARTLWAMSQSYHLFFAAEEAKQKSFLERYGRPTQAQRMEAYTWMAPHYDQNVSQLEAGIADHFRKEVFADASGDVLEVAVGTGRIFKFLDASKVKRYVGVDLNEAMLEEARKKLPALTFDARVVRSDGHALPFSDASFDTVVGSLCLCAMEHPEKALQEMLRVCRPCGKVLLLEAGIAEKPIVRWGQRHLGVVPNPTHEWEFAYRDDNDVLGLLRACEGLKVDKVNSFFKHLTLKRNVSEMLGTAEHSVEFAVTITAFHICTGTTS